MTKVWLCLLCMHPIFYCPLQAIKGYESSLSAEYFLILELFSSPFTCKKKNVYIYCLLEVRRELAVWRVEGIFLIFLILLAFWLLFFGNWKRIAFDIQEALFSWVIWIQWYERKWYLLREIALFVPLTKRKKAEDLTKK